MPERPRSSLPRCSSHLSIAITSRQAIFQLNQFAEKATVDYEEAIANVGGRMPFWRCRGPSSQADLHSSYAHMPGATSALTRLAVRSGGADRRLRVAPGCGRSVGRRVPPEYPSRARGACETAGSTRRRSEGCHEDAAH